MNLKKKIGLLVAGAAVALGALAHADDDDERKYRKGKHRREVHHHHHYYHGCPPPASEARQPRFAKAPGFPRESAGDRASARQRQREILLKELATEEQLQERAQRESGDPATIEQHQRNIDALRRELGDAFR